MDLVKKVVVGEERMSDHITEGFAVEEPAEQVEGRTEEWESPFLERRVAGE